MHHSYPTTSSTSSFHDLQNSPWDHESAQLFHGYDDSFDVNAQCSASSAANSLYLDAFALPVSQAPFQNSPDWFLPQTDSSCEFLTWNNQSIEGDVPLEFSFPIAAGTSLGNDDFLGQSDVGFIDNMSQSHSFLDNQTNRSTFLIPNAMNSNPLINMLPATAISTDQSSPPSPSPKSTTIQTDDSSPPFPLSTQKQTPSSSSSTMSRVEKRKLNTLAARRYRQKRLEQMSGLEAALKEVERERDALKVRVAKLEGETDILKSLLSKKG